MQAALSLRGSVAAVLLGVLLIGCGSPNATQSIGPPGVSDITAAPVPSLSRAPLLLCGHDYFGAMIPYVVDATSSDAVTIPANEKIVLRLSDDCAQGAAVQVSPGSAVSLSEFFPDQNHAVAAWASSPAGDSTLKLTGATGQVRMVSVHAGSERTASGPANPQGGSDKAAVVIGQDAILGTLSRTVC